MPKVKFFPWLLLVDGFNIRNILRRHQKDPHDGARANSRGLRLPCGCVDFYFEDANIIKIWMLSVFFLFLCWCGHTHNHYIHPPMPPSPKEKTHLNLWSITMPCSVHICVFIMNGLPLQPLLTMAACKKVCCDRCITNKFFRVDET